MRWYYPDQVLTVFLRSSFEDRSTTISAPCVEQLDTSSCGLETRTPVHESNQCDTLIIDGFNQACQGHVFHLGEIFCTLIICLLQRISLYSYTKMLGRYHEAVYVLMRITSVKVCYAMFSRVVDGEGMLTRNKGCHEAFACDVREQS